MKAFAARRLAAVSESVEARKVFLTSIGSAWLRGAIASAL
jgi:hypothetical protein